MNLLHSLLLLLKNYERAVVYVYDFLNFFALLVISSKSLNVFVKIEDQYSSAHVP